MDETGDAAIADDDADDDPVTFAWRAQPGPQKALLNCASFEVFFGGARGGGKTDGMLGEWVAHAARHGRHASGLMVRRQRTELVDTIERSKTLYSPLGAKYHEQEKLWRMPNGARLRFAYLERDSDAEAYQGHGYTRVYVEEIGNFPSQTPVLKLMATLRSGHGIPVGFRASGNPGGPGHQWVKARYIDPNPTGFEVIWSDFRNPWTGKIVSRDRVFIPSKLPDNKYLGDDYVAGLMMAGNDQLVRAWLQGDWSVIAGAFFPEFNTEQHVCAPCEIPADWIRFRAMDWGSARPFSVGWYAVSEGDDRFARGTLIKYREWYGMADGELNVGLKLTAEEVADGIQAREIHERIAYGVLDPSAFAQDGGASIADRMRTRGVSFRHADNARVARLGAMGGWDQLRSRLRGDGERPGLVMFSTCRDTIRTLPALQHDEARPEDVDTESEDHAADETRYACMSRPYLNLPPPKPRPMPHAYQMQADGSVRSSISITEMIARQKRRREGDG